MVEVAVKPAEATFQEQYGTSPTVEDIIANISPLFDIGRVIASKLNGGEDDRIQGLTCWRGVNEDELRTAGPYTGVPLAVDIEEGIDHRVKATFIHRVVLLPIVEQGAKQFVYAEVRKTTTTNSTSLTADITNTQYAIILLNLGLPVNLNIWSRATSHMREKKLREFLDLMPVVYEPSGKRIVQTKPEHFDRPGVLVKVPDGQVQLHLAK